MQSLVKIVDGDICNAKEKYIVHQCNCVSKGARGVAQTIFKKFPYSNVYAQRTKHDVPGTIKICGNGVDKRFIIALFGQYGWGKPDNKMIHLKRDSISLSLALGKLPKFLILKV